MIELPIDPSIPDITGTVRRRRAVVVIAPPGAGKTTRVPPALVDDGPVILLQPRRVAARAIARRIAEERGWTIGREVGWQMRFDRRFGADTRLLVATEGILTARLQHDPLLSDFRTIILDEFHERSIHADVAIALAKQAWRARADLRIVVMSATLDAAAVSRYLDGCPVVDVPGRVHPVTIGYAPSVTASDAAADLLGQTRGDILCFLPGAAEIRQTIRELGTRIDGDVDAVPLYGALDSGEQDRALQPDSAGRRRVVVATNIAETSLTVPGVTAVVDSGLHKVARYDPERGVDSLEAERITQDAADQRAGRAGRVAPGRVTRLWDARDRLRPHREPEIHRVDLSSTVLDVLAWGGDPRAFDWFELPRQDALDAALLLLGRLGAVAGNTLTDRGRLLQRFPLHPRLACMLIAAGGARRMAYACALIAERRHAPLYPLSSSTASDLLSALDNWAAAPEGVKHAAREFERIAVDTLGNAPGLSDLSDDHFCRAVFAGYPDRVAQRREPGSSHVKLASGGGGVLTAESGVRDSEYLVAIDLQASTRADRPDARIRVASQVAREWLRPTHIEVQHRFKGATGTVRAWAVEKYDALVLSERPAPVDIDAQSALLADAWLEKGPAEADVQLLRRLRFLGEAINLQEAVHAAARGVDSLAAIRLASGLTPQVLRRLENDAPATLRVPSGRAVPLEYLEDGGVRADVKLQELFGLTETPTIGPRREPVLFALLAPNGRPVQMTRDLGSFWRHTYPLVRKELRGRYPKHPWPDNPWTAVATGRPKRRGA